MLLVRVVLLIWLLVPSWTGTVRIELFNRHKLFRTEPVRFDSGEADPQTIGRLRFERGFRLTSDDPEFGGFSSMHIDGDSFTLLSDSGEAIRFRLDRSGRVSQRKFTSLAEGPASGWQKRDRDSESMTIDPATGQTWIGFENGNEIWRYRRDFGRAEAHAAPPAMRNWPENKGPEAMVRLKNGRFIVFAEDDPWPKGRGRAAVSFAGDPTRSPDQGFRFSYLPPNGFDPVDVAELPDGRLIILNRQFQLRTGFTAAITIVDTRQISPAAKVAGIEIARFTGKILRDNFEAIAVVAEADGTKIWIASDDNQNFFEQSLLLKFRLDEPAERKPRR